MEYIEALETLEESEELIANRRYNNILEKAIQLAVDEKGYAKYWYDQYRHDIRLIKHLDNNECITYLEFLIEMEKAVE